MSVLLTGGAGYIGSHVVLSLLEQGRDVVVLDNLVTGFREAVDPRATFVMGDIADTELLSKLFSEHGIKSVMHFAGSTVVPESVQDPLKYYTNNTGKSSILIQECLRYDIEEFVFSSTAAVYGSGTGEPVSESTPLSPESPYAQSKLMTERVLEDVAFANENFNYIALRYFNVAGADPQGRTGQSSANATHLIKVACQAALGARAELEVYGTDYPTPDGTGVRDYIHVSDLADAHLLALEYLESNKTSQTLNCGYGRGYSVSQVIKAVEDECKLTLPVRMAPRRPGDPASVVANSGRLHELLDWSPKHDDLGFIVRTAYDWEARCLKQKAS